jgi:hypothetical protein
MAAALAGLPALRSGAGNYPTPVSRLCGGVWGVVLGPPLMGQALVDASARLKVHGVVDDQDISH